MTSQSAPGSLLGNVDMYINEAVITNTSSLRVAEHVHGGVRHNNSNEQFHYSHNIQPSFRLTANNTFSSQMSDYSITFNASSLAKLRDTLSVQCTDGATRYLILRLNLVLTSDSLYHLGDHKVHIYGHINLENNVISFFDRIFNVRVQAGIEF